MAKQKITFAADRYDTKTKAFIAEMASNWRTSIRDAETRLLNTAADKELKKITTTTKNDRKNINTNNK